MHGAKIWTSQAFENNAVHLRLLMSGSFSIGNSEHIDHLIDVADTRHE